MLLARAHYFYDADPVARSLDRAGRLLDVAAHPSIETLCLAADVLVTDYSSLMFDYAVLDRPIVIHAPDWERYRATRGVYFDLMAEPPGVVCRSQDELLDVLRSGAVTTPEADAQRAAFRARFCAWRTAAPPSASCAGSCSETTRPPRRPRPRSHEPRARAAVSSSSWSASAAAGRA